MSQPEAAAIPIETGIIEMWGSITERLIRRADVRRRVLDRVEAIGWRRIVDGWGKP